MGDPMPENESLLQEGPNDGNETETISEFDFMNFVIRSMFNPDQISDEEMAYVSKPFAIPL